MKRFKLSLALLSAGIMAYSPVTLAKIDAEQKNEINQMLKERWTGTYSEIYQRNPYAFDQESRGYLEAWLTKYGKQKVEAPQAQIIKSKNGTELIKLVFGGGGSTTTLTIDPNNSETVDINGVSFRSEDVSNLKFAMNRLAQKDQSLQKANKSLQTAKAPKAIYKDFISGEQVLELTPIKRVEYFQNMRLILEAGEQVMALQEKTQANYSSSSESSFVLHPLIASHLALAAEVGQTCVIAGNVSVYVNGKYYRNGKPTTGTYCDHKSISQPQPTQHHMCPGTPMDGGDWVACPGLMYGFVKVGNTAQPICQSTRAKDFTDKASANCNEKSPLEPDKTAAYKRILESYAAVNNKDFDSKSCFGDNKENKIANKNDKCVKMFQDQVTMARKYKDQVDAICAPPKYDKMKPDQKAACDSLKLRTLGMLDFLGNELRPLAPIVAGNVTNPPVAATQAGEACNKVGELVTEPLPVCRCRNGQIAQTSDGGKSYSCNDIQEKCDTAGGQLEKFPDGEPRCKCPGQKTALPLQDGTGYEKCQEAPPVVTAAAACTGFWCGDGLKKIFPWLAVAVGVCVLWLCKDKKKSNPATPPPPPIIPWPTMTMPSEGSNKKPPPTDNSGGTRGGGVAPRPVPSGSQ